MIMSGPDDGLEVTLDDPSQRDHLPQDVLCAFTIGRRDNSDLCIPFDTLVSRLHATLQVRQDGLWLTDEGSRNGTFVGRRRIKEPEQLAPGQLFRVGQTWLRVEALARQNEG
jgi:pSer/pThr/pTyr-binding forkhead associated (FHA) protein